MIKQKQLLQSLTDVNYHLDDAFNVFKSLQLDCNRNMYQYLTCDKGMKEIQISKDILNSTDLTLPIKIALEVNRLFSVDNELSGVRVLIINSKRRFNFSSTSNLTITV